MTTDSWNHHTINSKMRRRIISLTLVACFTLSLLSFTPSTATAKPISHNNNQALNSASQASTKNRHHYQQAQNNHGGLLNRLSSSWTSLTTPLQGLHAVSGSPGPASVSHSGAGVKRLHKRAVDMKKPTTATAATSGGKKGGAQLKKVDKSTARAKRTYAAYEAIVNSDSQMPVFLNQHHPMTTNMGSNSGMRKGKPTSLTTPVAAGGEKKKAGAVTPIDILRQTGTKRPTAAAAASPTEGMTPAKDPQHPIKINNNNTNKLSTASRAAVAAAMEDGISTVKTLFDNVFAQEGQQPSRRNVVESATGPAFEGKGENSEDIEAIKETINAAAHAVVAAAAAAAVAGNSQHDTSPSGHHLEERDATGILKQALEDIAHKIEQAATAAIALEIPSLTDHTLDSHSSAASHEGEALEGERLAPVFENHQDAIVDDEGAVDLLAIANNNNNYHDTTPASTTGEEFSSTITKQKPGPIFINDNEYISHSSFESSDTTTTNEWHLIDNNDDDFDYMSQYIHRQPDNFPGSESILFTGTVLQRTLASSFLLLSGFVMLVGLISYKMYARRKTTSPWAFLHYMTFGVFGSLFYDSAYLSNSTLNTYTTTSQASPSSTMKKGFGSGPTGTTAWFRRSSLTRPTTSSSSTGHSHHIMSTPAEKEPLLPEPVVASSSSSSSSSASSLFNKSGGANRSELRRTSTAQHHQMQIELALQQQQRREEEQQQQQAEMDYLQRSFMRRTSL
ncbi:hypothetical protein BGZ90_009071 [Linnemannia elongata]|nr:hypothetical protein BGZ90_009071 [Linnemannia elongata]